MTTVLIPHTAEDVLPGHPTRLAELIAERVVDTCLTYDSEASLNVEARLFQHKLHLTGRIALRLPDESQRRRWMQEGLETLRALPQSIYWEAGYRSQWAVDLDVQLDLAVSLERGERGTAEDQSVAVGYAYNHPGLGFLPPAVYVARRLRETLQRVQQEYPDQLGPDGKVLIYFTEQNGDYTWRVCNVAIQHAPEVGYDLLYRRILSPFEETITELETLLPGLRKSWSPLRVRVNGQGQFTRSVSSHAVKQPGVERVVGTVGGALSSLSGKDPHCAEKIAALRARQLAVRLVREGGAREAQVTLSYLPGQREPNFGYALVNGSWWDWQQIAAAVPLPDLSIKATHRDLNLDRVCWETIARQGYFGGSSTWER